MLPVGDAAAFLAYEAHVPVLGYRGLHSWGFLDIAQVSDRFSAAVSTGFFAFALGTERCSNFSNRLERTVIKKRRLLAWFRRGHAAWWTRPERDEILVPNL